MANIQRFLDVDEEPLKVWSAIEDFENQPLISFDDATKILQQWIPNLDKQMSEMKQSPFEPTDGLTADEAAAIYIYTLQQADPTASVCTQLNRILRSTARTELKPWLSYLKLFTTALGKLPPFQSTIYRGVRGDVSDRYRNEFTWAGFSSCTESINVIEEFLGQSDARTIFEITCINGRSIVNYSHYGDQNEVLLMPGACLHFVDKRSPDKGLNIIRLQEVHSKYSLLPVAQLSSSSIATASTTDGAATPNEEGTADFVQSKESGIQLQGKHTNYDDNKNSSPSGRKPKASDIPHFPSPHDRMLPHKIQIGTPQDSSYNPETLGRLTGSLVGLAVGDALGASVEFRSHAYLLKHPVTEMQSGGTWNLKAGQWTDDTSMALCLASSLITKQGFDPYDQLVRYKWWHKHGFLSSTGHCFDIGSATRRALHEFCGRQKILKEHFRCRTDQEVDQLTFDAVQQVPVFNVNCSSPNIAGNGALMRLAPVPLFYFRSPTVAIEYAGRSAVITHGDRKAVDACRYYAALIVAVIHEESREKLLSNYFYEEHKDWFQSQDLHPDILRIAQGSYKQSKGYEGGIRGKGYIVNALEAALWAFWSDNDSFETGVLAAIQLGDDTDTTAAIYGQLAGAFYDHHRIPQKWRKQLYAHDLIVQIGHWLHFLGSQTSASEQ